ncbi:hypothetical protein [Ralstonia pseudosolanacearum]|uniref:hypothetical protein n=1 Tax=Ralstonia pseudosolanacearum TaxID=1310165 RepID=UPI003CED5BD4
MNAQLMNSTAKQGRKASGLFALVSNALNGLFRASDMATTNHGNTSTATAQADALCQPSTSLRPSLDERHESISILPASFVRLGFVPGYQWDRKFSTSIRGDCPLVAGVS